MTILTEILSHVQKKTRWISRSGKSSQGHHDNKINSSRHDQMRIEFLPSDGAPNNELELSSSSMSTTSGSTYDDGNDCFHQDFPITQSSTCNNEELSFMSFRLQYLVVFAAIMLADGLQGTHLYVLYEGYGYSVASLYALGFAAGGITSLFTGAIVDKIGRKSAVVVYCILEIFINYLEQYPVFAYLVVSRVIGGITTNLLFTVFEAWLVTEHRKRQFQEEQLVIILRDANMVSNGAAIISGYTAHCLATAFGPVGPFEGAVTVTFVALLIVATIWNENYGNEGSDGSVHSMRDHLKSAYKTITEDKTIACIGIIHGLTEGSIQTFVFLWSPMLSLVASTSLPSIPGLDTNGEPAYGLVFGAFMLSGVLGGYAEPKLRKTIENKISSLLILSPHHQLVLQEDNDNTDNTTPTNDNDQMQKFTVHVLCVCCYLCSALLFFTPCVVNKSNPYTFAIVLSSFLLFEVLIGIFVPLEGVVRSIYMPNESMCSIMTMLRFITNFAVTFGVIFTKFIPMTWSFFILSLMMLLAAIIQLSFIPREMFNFKRKAD
mmetsp:Transcript_1361/g.1678  ORF Transcript_1361/g.1678 Transcript_1361/m.1678 type:complete len:547 (-) Transcript_1361:178-1818(-)